MKRLHWTVDNYEVRMFAAGLEKLSPRELAVAQGTLQGWSAKDMAAHLGISHRTVEVHRTRAFTKLGVYSIVDFFRVCAYVFMREAASAVLAADRAVVQSRLAKVGEALAA